jgi:OOP family OmpA-OmpF porin
MNIRYSLLTLLSACVFSTHAQEVDSLVYAEGRIVNAETREPVVARIVYESVPYGSRIGVINNSQYSFPMFAEERYSLTVEASGFVPVKFLLDPSTANDHGRVVKDIELTTGERKPTHTAGQVLRLDNLIFEVGKAKIEPASYDELDVLVKLMSENPNMVIQLEGHTDYLGDPRANMRLSQQRVEAVRDYLVGQGVSKNRLRTKAFGGSKPLSRDSTPEAHRLNRRVEVRILQN